MDAAFRVSVFAALAAFDFVIVLFSTELLLLAFASLSQ
jgi:hypothetical protein